MSDLQTFTGIAILVSGFLSLQCGSDADAPPPISAYHWDKLVELAWFSTLTHLAALSVLRSHFIPHRRTRLVRFLLSFVLLVLLLTAMGPAVFFNWREQHAPGPFGAANAYSPAICFYDLQYARSQLERDSAVYGTSAFQGTVFSAVLLLLSFLSRTVKLFRHLSRYFNTSFRRPIGNFARRAASWVLGLTRPSGSQGARSYLWTHFCLRPVTAFFLTARVVADLFASLLLEVRENLYVR